MGNGESQGNEEREENLDQAGGQLCFSLQTKNRAKLVPHTYASVPLHSCVRGIHQKLEFMKAERVRHLILLQVGGLIMTIFVLQLFVEFLM